MKEEKWTTRTPDVKHAVEKKCSTYESDLKCYNQICRQNI